MDSGESDKQKEDGDYLLSDKFIFEPIWLRHFSLQVDTINKQLLAYNVGVICVGGPILWIVLSII